MASALLEQSAPAASKPRASWWNRDRAALAGVALFALAVAVPLLSWFWQHSNHLWYWIDHDRHTHYNNGLVLAMDVRHGNLRGLVSDLDGLRMWGPLHSVLIGVIQVFVGPDHRFAVVPSWCAWIGAVVLCFLLARRLVGHGGNCAGLVAAAFFVLSPTHKAFATDVMLESLGAFLSLSCFYAYFVLVQDGSKRAGYALGSALTLLFLHKYNYWLLVVMGLSFGELTRQPLTYWHYLKRLFAGSSPSSWLARQLRQPLNYLMLGALGAAVWVGVTGGAELDVAGIAVSVQKPHNLIHAAYLCFFVQLVRWWRTPAMQGYREELPDGFRASALVHAWAVAIYFLLPKRLANFLWFVGPFHGDRMFENTGFLHGLPVYSQALVTDYHVTPWSAGLAVAFLALAATMFFSFRKGSGAVVAFLLISFLLACQHPLLKNRFMVSWVMMVWVLGAAGLASALYYLCARRAALHTGALAIAALALLGAHGTHYWQPGHCFEGGVNFDRPSTLSVPAAYLPALKDSRHPTILSNLPIQGLLSWTYQERYDRQQFDADIRNFEQDADYPAVFARWLKSTPSDTVVLVDVHRRSPLYSPTTANRELRPLQRFLASSGIFEQRQDVMTAEKVRVTIWSRRTEPRVTANGR